MAYGQTQSRDAELTLVTIHTKSQFGWKANESLNRGRRGGRPFFRNPGAVRAALNDHNVERARAPKHRERRRAPPPRALAWVGSTRCGAQHALSCVAPAVAEPTAARTGAEWLPDRARQAQSRLSAVMRERSVKILILSHHGCLGFYVCDLDFGFSTILCLFICTIPPLVRRLFTLP